MARFFLVRVLKVGVDATDREINDALYGNAPPGFDYLVLGHESFGIVEAVGSAPQDAGTKMLVESAGRVFGTVGGGKIEHKAIETAKELIEQIKALKIKLHHEKKDAAKIAEFIAKSRMFSQRAEYYAKQAAILQSA